LYARAGNVRVVVAGHSAAEGRPTRSRVVVVLWRGGRGCVARRYGCGVYGERLRRLALRECGQAYAGRQAVGVAGR